MKSYLKELNKEYNLDKYKKIMVILTIFFIGGIFGFIYETIFYRIDLGYFVKRGTLFGPWIPIYAFGALLIYLLTFKLKNKPLLIFIISTVACGLLEFITGYILYKYCNLRLWDYNTEIWNFGNINGYICFRSVLFFGLSGLFLTYFIIPSIKKLFSKLNNICISCIAIIPSSLLLIDFIIHDIIK